MCHGCCHRKYHAEAMEHGYLDHHPVGSGQIHAVTDGLTVVYYIIMSKHYTLREACGTRSVLHICNIMLVDEAASELNFLLGYGA